ncbi:MAG: hypothetical protein QOC60_242 [Frankiaceae bacterium]|nr:hypothetical protein [Frankiaceae bacterium]
MTTPRFVQVAVSVLACLSLALPAAAAVPPATDPPGTVALAAGESVPAGTRILGASDSWVLYGESSYNATSLRDGHTVPIGGHGDVPHLAGSMVVIAHVDLLEWTDLDTGESGTAAFPAGTFEGATPTGWLLGTGATGDTGAEFVDARTGAVQPIGVPAQWRLATGLAHMGPQGVLLVGSGSPSLYVPYAAPGTVTPLALNSYCPSLTTIDAACANGTSVTVLPLSGAGPVTWAVPQSSAVAETVTRIGWTDYDGRLHTADKDGSHQLVSTTPIDMQAATSDAFLFVGGSSAADAGIYRLTDVGATPTLVAPLGAGTLHGRAIAVGPGRVAWIDNASSSSAVWSQTAGTGSGVLVLGPRLPVAATASAWMGTQALLSTSGRRTVYGTFMDLQLFENGRTSTLVHLTSNNWIGSTQLSGSRLLFTRGSVSTVIDVRTRRVLFTGQKLVSPALFGNYLAYARSDGSVWRKDLATGRLLALQAPVRTGRPTVVVQRGDFVAWQSGATPIYRNARTLTAPVRLPANEYLVGLTGVGVLTATGASPGFRVLLRAYNSRTATTVFTHNGGIELKVSGSAIAWLDDNQHYEPKIAPLPAGRDRPQLLGNALVPLSTTTAHTWLAEWDTSAPLTSCAVQLIYGRTTVRTLACDPAGMAVGVATVNWDGKGRAGKAVIGRVAWRLVAGNRSGSVLAPDGRATATAGVVTSR